ncbi:protein cereblon-like isoform X2 [Uloborus diversus]|uniref:protein cereblon-like isoform X2 n=1 Tax=Uloborus diversus TaxID=327109 RepID=UPI00240A045A|nr:protein cereblon-like isoform X2 [Uloborus diversus]
MLSFIAKIIKKRRASTADPSSSHENDQVTTSDASVLYDTSLPALHSYLGSDLEELSGRTVLDDDSCQTIPLLTLPGVVLIPGQTLPLQLFNPATVSMLVHIIKNDRTFGMINSRFSGRTFNNVLDPIGTTAEVRSYREGDELHGINVLRVKAEGRQRFEVLETRRQADGMIIGKVRILPELELGDPSVGAKLSSLDKFRDPLGAECRSTLHPKPTTNYKSHKNKYDFANYTWFPPFVYKMFDQYLLIKKIKAELKGWNRSVTTDSMPCNPKEFSYWVAANLPLDDTQRLALLSINEVTHRLKLELKILEECSVLCCKDCNRIIAHRDQIFSMSLQGPQGTYVNPNGYVHEAITVHKAKNLLVSGRPSTEQSWFPGYAWTIAECEQCHCHMGWKFTSVKKNLKPSKFWALCRSAIHTKLAENVEISIDD